MTLPAARPVAAFIPAVASLALLWVARQMSTDQRKDFGVVCSLGGAGGFAAFAGWCWDAIPLTVDQAAPAFAMGLIGARLAWIVERHWGGLARPGSEL